MASDKTKLSFFKTPFRTSLKRVVAIPLLTVSAAFLGSDFLADVFIPGRALTENETVMLKKTFKDSIDYSKVRVHHSEYADAVLSFLGVEGRRQGHVLIFNSSSYHDDFSNSSVDDKHEFVHETAHLWQKNNCQASFVKTFMERAAIILGQRSDVDVYDYQLEKGKDLTEYGIEQQAELLAQYFELKTTNKIYGINEKEKTMDKFEDTLKNFLKDPSYPRKDCWSPF